MVDFEELKATLGNLVDEARPFAAVDKRARAMSALENAMKEEQAAVQIRETQIRATAASDIAVIFDLRRHAGSTSRPRSEVRELGARAVRPNVRCRAT